MAKEKEIAVIRESQIKIESNITHLVSEMGDLKKYLMGNGKPGKIKDMETKIEENKTFRIKEQTKNDIIKYSVGAGWATTIVLFIVALII